MATSLTALNNLLIKKLISLIESGDFENAHIIAQIYALLPE